MPRTLVGDFSGLIFERMTDIEERFAGNGNDGSLIERQLFRRVSCPSGSRALTVETATNVKPTGAVPG